MALVDCISLPEQQLKDDCLLAQLEALHCVKGISTIYKRNKEPLQILLLIACHLS